MNETVKWMNTYKRLKTPDWVKIKDSKDVVTEMMENQVLFELLNDLTSSIIGF